jgi:hypothetical protein
MEIIAEGIDKSELDKYIKKIDIGVKDIRIYWTDNEVTDYEVV